MATIHLAQDFTAQITEIISPSSINNCGGLYLGNY